MNSMIHRQRGRALSWKSPFEWSDKEVHDLIEREVGKDCDIIFPVGYRVLLKLYKIPEQIGKCALPETFRSNNLMSTGMVIGMGADAFTCRDRFPSGPWCTYGEWVNFVPFEDKKLLIYDDVILTHVTDERILSLSDPAKLDYIRSTLTLEDTYKGEA